MNRVNRLSVALTMLPLLLGCATMGGQSQPSGATPPTVQTVVLDRDDMEPDRVTLAKGEGVTFRNTRGDLVKLVFRGAGDVSKKITCKRPAGSPPGPALKTMTGPQGNDFHLYLPPGPLGGVCTFAPGDYTFDVIPEVGMATDETPPQGQVFAK